MEAVRGVKVRVWGPYACFTRPDFKVERVSYLVMTPSAARGVLESIYWKPEFRYEIHRIGVVKIGTQLSILRNELSDRQTRRPVFVEDQRQQRTSLILKDVEYLIHAQLVMKPHARDPAGKYLDCFNRRVERGQYHHTPYLGTREFAASFAPGGPEVAVERLDLDLGLMLFDTAYVPAADRAELEFVVHGTQGRRVVGGMTKRVFFRARLASGWLESAELPEHQEIPQVLYRRLRELEAGHVS